MAERFRFNCYCCNVFNYEPIALICGYLGGANAVTPSWNNTHATQRETGASIVAIVRNG